METETKEKKLSHCLPSWLTQYTLHRGKATHRNHRHMVVDFHSQNTWTIQLNFCEMEKMYSLFIFICFATCMCFWLYVYMETYSMCVASWARCCVAPICQAATTMAKKSTFHPSTSKKECENYYETATIHIIQNVVRVENINSIRPRQVLPLAAWTLVFLKIPVLSLVFKINFHHQFYFISKLTVQQITVCSNV